MRFVPAESLTPGMVIGRDIQSNMTRAFLLKKGVVLDNRAITYIRRQGYMGVYVSDAMSAEVELEEVIDQQLFNKGLEAVASANVGSIISVSAEMVAQISSKGDISVDLFDLRSFDDYTFHHSVNVAVYASAVGCRMGISDDELRELTLAALCHDLGKTRIPLEILNKPDRLSDAEFEEMKNHSRYSYEMLRNEPVSSKVRQAVLLHHENENGTGYPMGKFGHELPLFAKIIHAVDVYDALTSRRPYKDPFAPADAINYIMHGSGILFDEDVVYAMNQVIPAYPPGIEVQLSNGEHALVVGHTHLALRPRVKLQSTGEIINLSQEQYADITIVKSDIMPSDYVGDIDMLNEDRGIQRERQELILIVDDDFLIGQKTQEMLKGKYDTRLMRSGLELIQYFDAGNSIPDLIICDYNMPVMDGIRTAERLRLRPGFSVPIIFTETTSNIDMIMKCKKVRAVDFVLKPINPGYLQDRVDLALHYMR